MSRRKNDFEALVQALESTGMSRYEAKEASSRCYSSRGEVPNSRRSLVTFIEQLLNRDTALYLSDYARKSSKAFGVQVTVRKVRKILARLCREGKVTYYIIGKTVYGTVRCI